MQKLILLEAVEEHLRSHVYLVDHHFPQLYGVDPRKELELGLPAGKVSEKLICEPATAIIEDEFRNEMALFKD